MTVKRYAKIGVDLTPFTLEKKDLEQTAKKAEATRDLAHKMTKTYIQAMAGVAKGNEIHMMFTHKEVLVHPTSAYLER